MHGVSIEWDSCYLGTPKQILVQPVTLKRNKYIAQRPKKQLHLLLIKLYLVQYVMLQLL
jgi:hypothetical protein